MRSRLNVVGAVAAIVLAAAMAGAQSRTAKMTLTAQDYLEIQQLYARYAMAIDSGDAEGWADTFTSDGVFNNSSRGRTALVQFVHDWRAQRNGAERRHWNSNLQIIPSPFTMAAAICTMRSRTRVTGGAHACDDVRMDLSRSVCRVDADADSAGSSDCQVRG